MRVCEYDGEGEGVRVWVCKDIHACTCTRVRPGEGVQVWVHVSVWMWI